MYRILDWAKRNKILTAAILIIIWLLWPRVSYFASPLKTTSYDSMYAPSAGYGGASNSLTRLASDVIETVGSTTYYEDEAAPVDSTDRMIVKNTSLAMVVTEVRTEVNKIVEYAEGLGGYMVSSNLSRPEEQPYATVVVRVPADKLDAVMEYYRSLGTKITSEIVSGRDVTDQYTDIDEHISQLEKTKGKYEEIRDKAEEISDLLEVTRQITSIQQQIDNYKGQQKYLEQTALLSKVSVTLSSDELALPYTPTDTFRPTIVFKEAVRGLYGTMRDLGNFLIWVGVYAVIWIPLGAVAIIWYRKGKTNADLKKQPKAQ